ncbi:SecDF P1 head subdomain-containing protein [Dactylosporangium sp. CA-152071]|uniref:SecDF P1 head subdomain-containing protein n=1 Tax=Dactylosporangium sp. CA-152071 TaxID=3239933 RepID=UPI003D918722
MALRGRQVLVLVAAVVAAVALAVTGIVLVLAKVGGGAPVSVTATATGDGDLEVTRAMLLARMKAAKLRDPSVTRDGDRKLVLTARGATAAQLKALTAPGRLHLRRVAAAADGSGAATSSLPAPTSTPPVAAALGDAYTAASSVTTEQEAQALPASVRAAFASLPPADVATLPARMRLLIPEIRCEQLSARPADVAGEPVVACEGPTKLLLDPATITGADIASADAARSEQGMWVVVASLRPDAQAKFTNLSKQLFDAQERLAIVLDNTVVSAPQIAGVIPGDVQVTGNFTESDARTLAAQLSGGGELPVTLTVAVQ